MDVDFGNVEMSWLSFGDLWEWMPYKMISDILYTSLYYVYWLVVEPPLWKIFVNWDHYSQYMEEWKMFQTTNQYNIIHFNDLKIFESVFKRPSLRSASGGKTTAVARSAPRSCTPRLEPWPRKGPLKSMPEGHINGRNNDYPIILICIMTICVYIN